MKSDISQNGKIMKFLSGILNKNKKDETIVASEIDALKRRIELLQLIIDDYRSSPTKYQRNLADSAADAYQQLVIDKTKLEMQYLFLTKWY